MAAIAAEEALLLGRAGARLAMSRAARRAAMRGAAKYFGRAYRVGSRFVKKNPFTAGTLAGYGLEKVRFKGSKKRKLSRPPPGVKKPRTVAHPGSRLIPFGGSNFRKLKRPKRQSKFLKYKKDTSLQVTDANCGWVGIHGNGGYTDFVEVAAASMLRAIFAHCKWHPNSMDSPVYLPMSADTDSIEFITSYRGVTPSTGDVVGQTDTYTFAQGTTFQNVVNDFKATVLTQLGLGRVPDVVTVRNSTKNQILARQVELGQSYIEIHVTTIAHMQNQTLAAQTGADHDVANAMNIHAQPLSGKMYYFNNAAAIVKPEVNIDPSIFQDEDIAHGVWAKPASDAPFNGSDRLLHPPNARTVFDNCKAASSISFAPGEVKKQKLVLSFKGTIAHLFNKLNFRNGIYNMNQYAWGKQIVVCVERTVRHATTNMELALNVERHFSAYVRLKHHRAGITKYNDIQI